MASYKPAYLICGDDHGRITERRARLRALAEADPDATLELIEGVEATPAAAAALLSAMTLAIGRRFVIIDGAERWKEGEVEEQLSGPLATIPDWTTVAFFAREEGRAKAPAALHRAVRAAGGDVATETAVKEWELPDWALRHAAETGLTLDKQAAKLLVAIVGTRQARLAREIEKLALECGDGARLDADGVAERVGRSAERKAWTLADAVVARDSAAATRIYLTLRTQGERVESLIYWVTRRLREALTIAQRLEQGASPASLKGELRMPPRAASAFIADVSRTDTSALRGAVCSLCDLELSSRGGSTLDADTLALRTLAAITAA
ncbi:MAG TPA: DNA polymerase III subunit delta [Solirubrobacteraceae bacterium]|nr:DNA polymerase III subunit delta [Solirubrobacteraceae bacterium]